MALLGLITRRSRVRIRPPLWQKALVRKLFDQAFYRSWGILPPGCHPEAGSPEANPTPNDRVPAGSELSEVLERRYAGTVTPEELANLAHLRRARDLMDREYAQPLDVPALARAALMSTAHFSRQFRATYGETPYAYLMTRRIERAKALLRRGDLSVTEVCMAVGCTSLGSFSARFTQLVGETPSSYRARSHDELRAVPACQTMVLTRPRRGGRRGAEESSFGEASVATPA